MDCRYPAVEVFGEESTCCPAALPGCPPRLTPGTLMKILEIPQTKPQGETTHHQKQKNQDPNDRNPANLWDVLDNLMDNGQCAKWMDG